MTTETTKEIKIRLPEQLLNRLDAAAEASGQSRNALALACLEAEVDRPDRARALTGPLGEAVELVSQHIGDWRADAFAFEVLHSAVNLIIGQSKPAGDPTPHFNADNLSDLMFSATDTPQQTAKRIVAMGMLQRISGRTP